MCRWTLEKERFARQLEDQPLPPMQSIGEEKKKKKMAGLLACMVWFRKNWHDGKNASDLLLPPRPRPQPWWAGGRPG